MKRGLAGVALLLAALLVAGGADAGGGKHSVVCVEYGNSDEPSFQLRTKPRKCTWVERGEEPFGYNTVDMVRIHWSQWGTRKARGKGKFVVNMTGPVPGLVKLSKPEIGCGHRAVFTKATFIDPKTGDSDRMALGSCR
jgi:hypothetical protein